MLANYSRFLRLQPMKRNLLVAASLLGAVASISITRAEASPQFSVTAATPGAIQFSGSGTAQFNNSVGTNNSFQVGSSTNLGVNASTSSTPEYGVASKANLSLAGTSTLKQILGTSGGGAAGGEISGQFNTKERGSATTSGSMADWSQQLRLLLKPSTELTTKAVAATTSTPISESGKLTTTPSTTVPTVQRLLAQLVKVTAMSPSTELDQMHL